MDKLRCSGILTLFICCSILMLCSPVAAYRIALLPIADVTLERNGVDLQKTQQLIAELQGHGFDVISEQAVLDYMVKAGIRRCGEIDSFSCRKMSSELRIDAVLVTTVIGNRITPDQMSLLAALLHGDNGQTVWSTTQAIHINDKQPVFGIGATEDIQQIQEQLFSDLAQNLADQLPRLPQVDTTDLALAQILDAQITPSIVKGGHPVQCRIKLDFINTPPDSISVTSGSHSSTLQRSAVNNLYVGSIISDDNEGIHPVNLALRWFQQQESTIDNLCSYTVANEPAQLSLYFRSGLDLGDKYAFSDSIKIAPQMEPQRQIDMWRFTVSDDKGKTVFEETQYSDLPLEMRWRGNDNNMRRLDNGEYTLSLYTRDIAGNEAITEEQLYLQNTDMEMVSISQHVDDGKYRLELLPAEDLQVPISNWVLTIETETGTPIFSARGYQLPASVAVPDGIAQPGLIYQFRALDELGNHYNVADVRLEAVDSSGMLAQIQAQHNWSIDF